MKELKDYIIEYVETNKEKYNIKYDESIQAVDELLAEIKKEYEELRESE